MADTITGDEWLTIKQVVQKTGLKDYQIRNAMRNGRLLYSRRDYSEGYPLIMVRESDLNDWLNNQSEIRDQAEREKLLEKWRLYGRKKQEKVNAYKRLANEEESKYIPGDADNNIRIALQTMKDIYWANDSITIGNSSRFVEAQEIVLSALLTGEYDIVRKENSKEGK